MGDTALNLEPDAGLRTIASGSFSDAIFSSDGTRMFAVSGNVVSVIDVASGNVLAQYTVGTSLGAIDVSPDGLRLAVVERSNNVQQEARLYEINLSTGAITTHPVAGVSGPFFDVSFLSDGTALVSQTSIGNGSTPLRLFNFSTGQFSVVDSPATLGWATMTASADASHVLLQPFGNVNVSGSFLYVAGQGFVAQAILPPFDPYAGASLPTGGPVGVQATSPDGNFYVQGGTLNVYNSSLQLVTSLASTATFVQGAQGLTFSANGQFLYAAIGTSVIVYSTSNWQPIATYDVGGFIKASYDSVGGTFTGYGDIIQASPDGRYLSVITSAGVTLIDTTIAAYESTNGPDTLSGEGSLYGLGGNDDLSGVGTFTAMYGGEGDDTYHITGYSDTAWELPNQGHDTVRSVISFGLGENFEDLILDGTSDIQGYGNSTNNLIVGNSGNNELGGAAGNDTLYGNEGNDRLDGGPGNDLLDGGTGTDTGYYLGALTGVTVNLSLAGPQNTGGGGIDSLVSIENLIGSWQNDQLIGNSGVNRLEGFVGDDVLTGGLGADTLVGGDGMDTFRDTAAGLNGDTIEDFSSADTIIITDANINTFTYSLTGNVLTYSGGTVTFGSVPTGPVYAFAAAGGGVELRVGPFTGTMDQIAGELTRGYWDGEVHRWNVAPGGSISVDVQTLTFAERTLARAALTAWSDITGIRFQEVTSGAQITFSHAEEPGGPVAYTDSNWSNGFLTSANIVISSSWVTQYGSGLNTYSYQTYLHEIGHALGLGHSGDYNETATYPGDVIFYNDSWSASVMSYFDQDEAYYQAGDFSFAYAVTPMQADILAVQSLYGVSTTTRLNDTVYGYNSTAGPIYNANTYPQVAYTIFDSGGNDTLDFSGWAGGQTINLNAETFSNVNGLYGNVAIARGVLIENAIGGGGGDTIIGNALNNRITGNQGADTLTGGAGADTFQDTRAGFNGDTITDFGVNDRIVITDASLPGFTFNLTGNTLTWAGGSMTFSTPITGSIVATAASGGGVQLTISAMQFDTAQLVTNQFGASAASGGWASNNSHLRELADVNGDGRADIVAFGQNNVFVALGAYDGTFGMATAASSQFTSAIGWANETRYPRELADVNGDGRADIVGFGEDGVYVSLANGNGSFGTATLAVQAFGASNAAGGWTSNTAYLRTMADVNGDGLADIVAFGQSSVYVALGNANGGFAAPTVATSQFTGGIGWANENRYPRELADVNGDGRADIVGFGEAGVYVALGNANGTFATATLAMQEYGASAAAGGWTSNNTYMRTMADVDGDGRADIVAFGQNSVFIALSNGNGTFTDHIGTNLFTAAFGWSSNDTTPRILADVNGDGAADIVGFGANGTYVALSYGDFWL